MQEGDFVYIDYVGRVKDSGEIFDLTKEDVAKKENVYNPQVKYKPVPVIVGAGFVIKGLDEVLKEMKVGEKKTVEIPPEKAFGQRSLELIKIFPASVFEEKNVNPTPGSYVTINNLRGRIVSNDGGRVKVDFNHPLAGKKLEYEIEIKSKITDTKEKVKSIINFFSGIDFEKIDVQINQKTAEIQIKDKNVDFPLELRKRISENIKKWIKEIEKVRFISEF
jgi:FKBP-type peptidyl-prolyl cis-trans isomerase 2